VEASGMAASWRDIDAIVALWNDPTTDRAFWERVWCNRLVKSASQAFDVVRWATLARAVCPVTPGDLITLGFDGAMFHDATGLVATHVETGYQWMAGLWERPPHVAEWCVPGEEVDAVVRDLFHRFMVWRLYADPPYWRDWIATWAGDPTLKRVEAGQEVDTVVEWWTNRRRPMTAALEAFDTAIKTGTISHDGSPDLERHLGNARKRELLERDEQGRRLWLIQKERPDSPHKIDLAMAAVLSWEARRDAIASGANTVKPPSYSMIVLGGR